ncbi:MAG: membrane-bound lytic murein transglycosylase MltF [Desulfatibacillaceae bacterium]
MHRRLYRKVKSALKKAALAASVAAALVPAAGCGGESDLQRIVERGELVLITRKNSPSYHRYEGRAMGFDYEMAAAFAQYLGVRLRVVTPEPSEMIPDLLSDRGDIIAANFAVTPDRLRILDFSEPYGSVEMHLMVHRRNQDIQELADLAGRTVHVRPGTAYERAMVDLRRLGEEFNIETIDAPVEELLEMVDQKEIDVTVAYSNHALLNRRYYPNVEAAFPISEPMPVAWAVAKGRTGLLARINDFLAESRENGSLGETQERYYANIDAFDYLDVTRFHSRVRTRLPHYRDTIRETSAAYGFDWRLIAAVVYQESHFNPRATSFTGVRGIMQVTRVTAMEMGIIDRTDPVQSIDAGVGYLRKMYDRYDYLDEPDRMHVALAAYNVGHGHVADAMKLAGKLGMDPHRWSSLKRTLPLLRYRKYYSQAVYGYCRGMEPVRYVRNVRTYHDILRQRVWST